MMRIETKSMVISLSAGALCVLLRG